MRIFQKQVQNTGIQPAGIKKLCGFRGYSQFFDILILPIRDVRLSQKEVCGYIKVLCNLDDIPVTEHLGLAFQVITGKICS
jgi:hypothetical protein